MIQARIRPHVGELKLLRLDNLPSQRSDGMYKFLAGNGTGLEFRSEYVPEELGVTERGWQPICKTAIAGMRQAKPHGCPLASWYDAMQDAVYKENHLVCARPKCDDRLICNMERLTGQPPNYDLMYAFWTPVRYFVDKVVRADKWDEPYFAGPEIFVTLQQTKVLGPPLPSLGPS